MIIVQIDYREKDLWNVLSKENPEISFQQINFPIGDIQISLKNSNDEIIPLLLIERKTLSDLSSSIKDGRYEEQSFRLNDCQLFHNHNVIYLIEGDWNSYDFKQKKNKYLLPKSTLLSSMHSIQFLKGFSLLHTKNVVETSEYIESLANKWLQEYKKKKGNRDFFYSNIYSNNEQYHQTQTDEDCELDKKEYSDLKMKKKNEYGGEKEIIELKMLSIIPGISNTLAKHLLSKYQNITNLILTCKENPQDILQFTYTTTTGKTKKASSFPLQQLILCFGNQ